MAAAIFNGDAVKILKNTLRFKDGTDLASTALVTLTNTAVLTNKTLTSPLITAGGSINLTAAGTLGIATNAGANNITIGGSTSTVVIAGNLQIDGTTISVNSSTMEVSDANILVNHEGNQASADSNDAGLTVEMSDATDAVIHYDSTATSLWKIGAVGSTVEVADISSAQTLTTKTIDSANNTLTIDADEATVSNIANANIKTSAAIALDKLAALTVSRALVSDGAGVVSASSVTTTELGYVSGVTSAIQTQLNSKIAITDIFSTNSVADGATAATANETYLVDTTSGTATITLPATPTAGHFVRVKDVGNAATNNITVARNGNNIEGAAADDVINSNYASVTYVADGTNWHKL